MPASYIRTSVPGVYKRGSRYVVTFTDPSGVRRKRSAATLADARLLKSSLTADVARGEYREQSRVRFDEYAAEWVRTFQGRTARGIRPLTLRDYARDLEAHVIPGLGRLRVAEITHRDIKRLVADLTEAGYAPSTIRNVIAPTRALFATAMEDGLVRVNPCTGIRISGRTAPGDHARSLTEDELAGMIAAADPEWRLLVRFLAETGLRIGELIALLWSDVDLEARRVRVKRRMLEGTIDLPKSHYGIRTVPLARQMAADLAEYRAMSLYPADGDLAFPTRRGTHIHPSNLSHRVIKPAAVSAGVPWASAHTLRHTCASRLFKAGWNAKQVQMMLGHHSPAFTLSTYVHLIPDDLPEPEFA
jgi:integrase